MPLDQPLLRLDTATQLPWEKRGDGRYWTHITLGVEGQELDYFGVKDGRLFKRTELVTKRGLLRDDSLKSLAQLPILLDHPAAKRYYLNKEGLKVGQLTGEIARQDKTDGRLELIAEAFIDDHRGVTLLDEMLANGQTPEASPCYDVYDLTRLDRAGSSNVYEQWRDLYDHIAAPLWPGEGRGGAINRLHCDRKDPFEMDVSASLVDETGAKQFFLIGSQRSDKTTEVATVTLQQFNLGSGTFSTEDPNLVTQANTVSNELTTLRSDKSTLEEENGTLKGQVQILEREKKELTQRLDSAASDAEIQKLVTDAVAIHMKAIPIFQKHNPEYRADSKQFTWTPFQVMQAAVITASPGQKDEISALRSDKKGDVGQLTMLFNYIADQATADGAGTQLNSDKADGNLEALNGILGVIQGGRHERQLNSDKGDPNADGGGVGEIDGGDDEVKRIQQNNVGAS